MVLSSEKENNMIINKRTSQSYLGTFDVGSVADMQQLEDLRGMVKTINKVVSKSAKSNIKHRIVVRGRKPVVKMITKAGYATPPSHGVTQWSPSRGPVSYDWGGNIVGGIKNATILDAYLYRR